MNIQTSAAVLRNLQGAPVPLQEVAVQARLRDFLSEVIVTQRYRNAETVAIEAVYTFPLPVDAVLLEVEATIGGKARRGQVVERKQAESAYEAAIGAGDAAIMIEPPAPDLYTMNLGNLLPGEAAEITFRYATVLRRQRGRVRFHHPTTIAPRYGIMPLEPHQQLDFTLLDERACRLEVEILGALAEGVVASPSHEVEIARAGAGLTVRLREGRLLMDRDFVLEIRTAEVLAPMLRCEADAEAGYTCLAVLHPNLPPSLEASPRDLRIVLDCSGSMQGDSIGQARAAAQRILEALRPQDRFNVILFGSTYRVLFPEMMAGDDGSVALAQRTVLDAMGDMGGTEMGPALNAAYALPVREGCRPTVLLVTDGEVGDTAAILRAARASGHRIFTVGVGSAVAEGLVQALARETGGACELVAPREDMAERILRHVRRIDEGGARLTIDWPAPAIETIGLDEPVFPGDTAIVFARFASTPQGEVRFSATLPDGRAVTERAPLAAADAPEPGVVARLAASRRLFELGRRIDAAPPAERQRLESAAGALAVRYQLLSPWSNWLLVVPQEGEAAGDLPALRKVPQILAAGWHGIGTVHERLECAMVPVRFFDMSGVEEAAFLFRESAPPRSRAPSLDDLAGLPGVSDEAIAALRDLIAEGFEESAVVAAFLTLLGEGSLGVPLDRQTRRTIRQLCRGVAIGAEVKRRVQAATAGLVAAHGADATPAYTG